MSRGNMRGTGVVGAVEYFVQRFGPAAAHAVIAQLPESGRRFVRPNAPLLGLSRGQTYPNAFVGDLARTMIAAVHAPDEDAFLREVVGGGIDLTVNTFYRMALRFVTSLDAYGARSQELWDLYHDSGKVLVLPTGKHERMVQVTDWVAHDPMVCKISMEGRRRILELLGLKNVEARRDKCQSWGHGVCLATYRWSGESGDLADATNEPSR